MKPPILRVPTKGSSSPNALTRYSLRGSASELALLAQEQKPLLGDVCRAAEANAWYAKYNTGKTALMLQLTIEAIQQKRIDPGNVIIVNADDSSFGLAEKVQLLEDLGAHMVAPGHKDFDVGILLSAMEDMIAADTAKGVFIVIDTLKKFVDVMDKKAVRTFTATVRRFVSKGGTFLALAHTNKQTDKNGKPVPEGTADVLSDFDCAYLLDIVGEDKHTGERMIEFTCVKSRGGAPSKAYYVYDPDPDISYTERLCSIREVDPDDNEYGERFSRTSDEADIIEAIELCMRHGTVTKMDIARVAAQASGESRRAVLKVLEKYTGVDSKAHRWNFARREHGRMVYAPLAPPSESA